MTDRAAELSDVAVRWRQSQLAAVGPVGLVAAVSVTIAIAAVFVVDPLAQGHRILQVAGVAAVAVPCVALVMTRSRRHVATALADLRGVIGEVQRRGFRGAGDATEGSDNRADIDVVAFELRRLVNEVAEQVAEAEIFAAELAHEIRNPLTSLRSAAEAMRGADAAQREPLLAIIESDVGRLDRLVGVISSVSRLDSELVREQAREFDLLTTVRELVSHLAQGAAASGIEIIADLPDERITLVGLEARLAQVIANLIDNAVSLCEPGDALRIWARRRDDRALIVVEDTGPGLKDGTAEKIFHRFYSDRPASGAGDNCGLGLDIARRIVEAHGGVIWAENIRPTESDLLSEPLGARFVVALPLRPGKATRR